MILRFLLNTARAHRHLPGSQAIRYSETCQTHEYCSRSPVKFSSEEARESGARDKQHRHNVIAKLSVLFDEKSRLRATPVSF